MAPFRLDDDPVNHSLPWQLAQAGFVAKYWDRSIFEEDLLALECEHLFTVRRFDCANWPDHESMHDELRVGLRLPDYTGRNFDALSDSLTDIEVPERGGLAIALQNLDASSDRDTTLLEILTASSSWWILFGRVQLVLFTVDDPQLDGPTVQPPLRVPWSPREFQRSTRAAAADAGS